MFDAGVTKLKEIAAVDPSSESLIARQSPTLATARHPRPLADQLFAFHGLAPGPASELPGPPAHLRACPLNTTAARQSGLFGVNFKDQTICQSPLFVSHKMICFDAIFHSLLKMNMRLVIFGQSSSN